MRSDPAESRLVGRVDRCDAVRATRDPRPGSRLPSAPSHTGLYNVRASLMLDRGLSPRAG
eukprot:622180-Prymnesium_polylepis.1